MICPICLIPVETGLDFEWIESDISIKSNKIINFMKSTEIKSGNVL